MTLTRRQILERLAATGVLPLLPVVQACSGGAKDDSAVPDDGFPRYTWDGDLGPEDTFAHGVASGDPLADAVVLWTRVSPIDATAEVDLFLEVSESQDFAVRVAVSEGRATPAMNFCFKVDLSGLSPATTYYYRWSALGRTSPIGRTRTLPVGAVDHLRVAVVSCSNYAMGYFHTYWYLSQRADIDLVVHLGDYIYEYGFGEYGAARPCEPEYEILTLEDYRARYSQYRRDPDLAEVHRQHPWVVVWDDHEFCCDPYRGGTGATNHQEDEGDWAERVAIAVKVYDEWMPTRVIAPEKIWRAFDLGDLARLCVADIKYPLVHDLGEAPTMLGEEQQAWVDEVVAGTTQPWFLLAQAQSFTDVIQPDGSGGSTWGEVPASRRRILDGLATVGVPNFVVLAGDTHRTRAADYTEDPYGAYDPATGAGSEGVELQSGSIASTGSNDDVDALPNHFWAEGVYRHYLVLDITPERLQADWFGYFDGWKLSADRPPDGEEWRKGYVTETGANHLVEAAAPAASKEDPPELAG